MNNDIYSRYANALFGMIDNDKEMLSYQSALKTLHNLFDEYPKLLSILSSEFLDYDDRYKIVDLLTKNFNLLHLSSFLKVLIKNHRINYFNKIQREFNLLVNEKRHIEEGIVYSAFALNDEQIHSIEYAIEQNINSKVELINKIDETLLGGAKVVIHDRIYDGSIKAKLNDMKKELLGGN
jgi:F-type H+-transporting ATPase subunit delta